MDSQIAPDATKAGHAPAHVAGGRRIKGANHVPLKAKDEEKSEEKIQQEEEQATEEDRRLEKIYDKELEHLRREEVARKLARDQEATQPKHMAWESNKPKPTNNKDIGIQQPRQHNHTTYRLGHVNKN